MIKAEVITIGDELLIGQTIDTNASWIGEQLNLIGIKVIQITSIQDNREQILDVIDQSKDRSDIVIITGGLGPTNDDITKNTLCEYFNSELQLNEQILNKIDAYFSSKNLEMLKINRDQALLPHNCDVLENIRGTASGMWFEKDDVIFISLPGVPFEMKGIIKDSVLSKLKTKFIKESICHKTVKTHGIGESFLANIINEWEMSLQKDAIKLAYLPSPGIVKLRLTARGSIEDQLEKKLDYYIDELNLLIPQYIYGYDKDNFQSVVGSLLKTNKQTLSLAESCTGGHIAKMITSVRGSSDYFKGSIVAYANEIKVKILDVDPIEIDTHGAVSQEVVEQMAIGVRKQFNTSFGLATSGIAGPDGGTDQKPVGTVWIAISYSDKVISKKFSFGKSRERNILVSSISALNMLRLEILNLEYHS